MVEETNAERLHAGISSALDNDEILANWVCISEIFDTDGERGIWVENADAATTWEVLGLLEYAAQSIRTRMDIIMQMTVQAQLDMDEDDE